LPDPLMLPNGTKIKSAEEWENFRRQELINLFSHNLYGYIPGKFKDFKIFNQSIDKTFLNSFATKKEIRIVEDYCSKLGIKCNLCKHWEKGGQGAIELANNVVELCKNSVKKNFKFLYSNDISLWKKIETIAKEIYGASEVIADTKTREQLKILEEEGFAKLPICVAKTQYSFSTDPDLKGAPTGHVLPIREVRLSSGAEFVVVICGSIMTMPGLPKVPAAESIKLNKNGEIEGLF